MLHEKNVPGLSQILASVDERLAAWREPRTSAVEFDVSYESQSGCLVV